MPSRRPFVARLFVALTLCLLGLGSAGDLRAQISFGPASAIAPATTDLASSLVAFDGDADGLPEVLVGDAQGLRLYALAGGLWTDVSAARLPGTPLPVQDLVAADFDADGDLDLVVSTTDGELRLLDNDGTGVFSDVTALRFAVGPTLNGPLFLRAAELDGDGHVELLVWNDGVSTSAPPQILWSDGQGGFDVLGPLPLPAGILLGAIDLDAVDLDDDLDLDLVVTSVGDGAIFCTPFRNDGFGGLLPAPAFSPATFGALAQTRSGPAFADLDGDDRLDLCVADTTGVAIALGIPGGGFGALTAGTALPMNGGTLAADAALRLHDLDMDGDLDAALPALVAPGAPGLALVENLSGLGTGFAAPNLVPIGSGTARPFAFADFDLDADLDLVEVAADGSIALRLNEGASDTNDPRILDSTPLSPSLRASRLNGDAPLIRARVQDAGGTLALALEIEVERDGLLLSELIPMTPAGADAFEARLEAPALEGGPVSATLRYRVHATDGAGNSSTSLWRETKVTGHRAFGPTTGVHSLGLDLVGEPASGETVSVEIFAAAPSAATCLAVSPTPATSFWFGGQVLFDVANFTEFELTTSPTGTLSLPASLPPSLVLERLILQAFVLDAAQPFNVALSPALDVTIGDTSSADLLPVFPPSIASLTPAMPNPGETVTISGLRFDALASVLVNGTPVLANVLSPDAITFVMPTVPLDCAASVTVVNENGQTALASIAPLPTVSHTVFGTGPAAGGSTFIVIGTGLGDGATVMIDGNPAIVTSTSPTSVICLTPPGTPGPKPAQVTNAFGCSVMTSYVYF